MQNPDGSQDVAISPEFLALYSIADGCGSADRGIGKLQLAVTTKQQDAFLDESIFFHHFMAIAAVFHVIRERGPRQAYCDAMVSAIKPGRATLPNEEFGLPPPTVYSLKDREAAVARCFFNFPAMTVGPAQDLYLRNEPSNAELEILNLKTVREMTGWGSPGRTAVQRFTGAFLARLSLALEIQPESRVVDFLKLSAYSSAASLATFPFYMELLAGRFEEQSSVVAPQKSPKAKGNWLSRLFR
jgi:hypothetical protein